MTNKEFEQYCNERACDGQWSIFEAIACIEEMKNMKKEENTKMNTRKDRLTTKDICNLGIGIALYVVLGFSVKFPLGVGHLQTDLGYIAFGLYCTLYGPWAAVVGGAGCVLESLVFNGWFPIGWLLGQLFIGVLCGFCFKSIQNSDLSKGMQLLWMSIIAVVAVFIGVGVIKTAIECILYSIPLSVKFTKNLIAFVCDAIPMVVGVLISSRFTSKRGR